MTYNPPALNHNYHPDPDHRAGCHNSPNPRYVTPAYQIRDGWNEDGTVRFVWHKTEWKPVVCGHSFNYDDPACQSCPWRTV